MNIFVLWLLCTEKFACEKLTLLRHFFCVAPRIGGWEPWESTRVISSQPMTTNITQSHITMEQVWTASLWTNLIGLISVSTI